MRCAAWWPASRLRPWTGQALGPWPHFAGVGPIRSASLSRAAYAYLIVFRPDGKDEVLYPQGAREAPEQTDEPRYPSKDRSKVYGLTDGTGLWLVALVASERPLPPYADWRQQRPDSPWA